MVRRSLSESRMFLMDPSLLTYTHHFQTNAPLRTSTQVTPVLHTAHWVVVNMLPLEMPVHQVPPSLYRPVMSALPSPLKSPTCTSTQVAPVLQVSHRLLLNGIPVV